MDLNIFLSPWTIFFAALIVIIFLMIILTLLEKKLKKKISIKKEEQSIFQRKLAYLHSQDHSPQQTLIATDALARDFFSQRYKLERNSKYSEFHREFKKQGNLAAAQFCSAIQEVMYSGESQTKEKISALVGKLEFLMKDSVGSQTINADENKTKPKLFFSRSTPKTVDKRIVNYLSEGLKRGFRIELLREKLFGAGFTKKEVLLAEEYLNLNVKKNEELPEEKLASALPEKKTPVVKQASSQKKDNLLIKSLDNLERIKEKISDKTEMTGAKKISERTGLI